MWFSQPCWSGIISTCSRGIKLQKMAPKGEFSKNDGQQDSSLHGFSWSSFHYIYENDGHEKPANLWWLLMAIIPAYMKSGYMKWWSWPSFFGNYPFLGKILGFNASDLEHVNIIQNNPWAIRIKVHYWKLHSKVFPCMHFRGLT